MFKTKRDSLELIFFLSQEMLMLLWENVWNCLQIVRGLWNIKVKIYRILTSEVVYPLCSVVVPVSLMTLKTFPCFCCLLPVFPLLLLSVHGLRVRILATLKASFICHVDTLEEKVGNDCLSLALYSCVGLVCLWGPLPWPFLIELWVRPMAEVHQAWLPITDCVLKVSGCSYYVLCPQQSWSSEPSVSICI